MAWYFVSDRLTPYTSQARVQAFVVPVSAQVSGNVLKVHVKNNDEVRPGQPLFDIDPTQYQIALQRSRSDYESVRLSVNASTVAVDAARATLRAAVASRVFAEQDATRLEQIYKEDPGALSVRRVQNAQASRATAESQEKKAEADLQRAQETAGERGEKNAQLLSARAAIEKAELDLKRTQVVAPAGGTVTDLRTDAGQFMGVGSPAMTLIAIHDLWISADMTENNLGNIKPGDPVAIVLDVMPGEVLKGRVRSLGTGISPGKPTQPGALPEVQNNRDWLRQPAQDRTARRSCGAADGRSAHATLPARGRVRRAAPEPDGRRGAGYAAGRRDPLRASEARQPPSSARGHGDEAR